MELTEALNTLRTTTKKADKKEFIQESATVPFFNEALTFLMNSYDVVGLSTKKINKDVDVEPEKELADFGEALAYLRANRTGTDKVIATVQAYLNTLNDQEREVIEGVLTKTIALGVSAKSVNEAFGEDIIPTFDVQLAFQYQKKIDSYADDAQFYVTQKLDGHRAVTTVEVNGPQVSITTYTRRGQQMDGMTELHDDVYQFIMKNKKMMSQFPHGFVLDGELLLKNPDNISTVELFQKTSTILRRDGEKKDITYNVFDVLPVEEFLNEKQSSKDYTYRRENWLNNLEASDLITVIPVLAKITKDEIPTWSKYATDRGWEGVMLNDEHGMYRKTRSPKLLKVKKMHTADLPIVGYNEAISGANKGGLQSINVQLDDDNVLPVGSGLTEELRAEIWAHKEKYLGVMVEVQYFEETTNANGGRSLRFPVFKDFRFDKTQDDINIE